MKSYPVISERTYNEWPEDHPLRETVAVLPDEVLATADVVICTLKGEPREPPAADDADVEATCHCCGAAIIHRRSAPAAPKECWRCYQRRG